MATRLAWSVALLCGLLAVPTVVLLVLGAGTATPADEFGAAGFGGLALLVAFLIFAVVGALIVSGVPGNSIGPLFCVIGSIGTIGNFAYQCADFSVYVSPGAFPGAEIFGLMQNLGLPPPSDSSRSRCSCSQTAARCHGAGVRRSGSPTSGLPALCSDTSCVPGPIEFPSKRSKIRSAWPACER